MDLNLIKLKFYFQRMQNVEYLLSRVLVIFINDENGLNKALDNIKVNFIK